MSKNRIKDGLWKQRIQEYQNSGLSLKAWCQCNNVKYSSMNYHLYVVPKREQENGDTSQMIQLLPVTTEKKKLDSIELQVSGATIKVDASTNMDLLSHVLRAIHHD